MAKVNTQQGVLIGGRGETKNGIEYFEFLQIPYAEAPLGELRFKSPQPPKPWDGERDATTACSKNIAHQIQINNLTQIGSEDCLYLNVFTPKLPTEESPQNLPVLFYIHGGAFVFGNGIIKHESAGDYLIEHDVVVVSINYRLGVFGFLSLDIPEAAGNMGLKDQVQALKWVRENISAFGGDKDNLTIFGVSAGAASVEYLLLSRLSAGLFSKAIIQSGSSLCHWAINRNIKELGIKLALELGYQGSEDDAKAIHDYLIELPADVLGGMALKITDLFGGNRLHFGFVPSIEKDFGNGQAFITKAPYKLLKRGSFYKVPVIRGFCEYEGMMTLGLRPDDVKKLRENKNFTAVWDYPLDDDDAERYNKMFFQQYLEGKSDEDKEEAAVDFFSHYDFTSGILTASKMMAVHKVPLYLYMFAFDGSYSYVKSVTGLKRKGACHGDDTHYTMCKAIDGLGQEIKLTDSEALISKRISMMWTSFAKTGNPTPSTCEVIPLTWPIYEYIEQSYLVIDEPLQVKTKYQPERIAIFEEIYEKYEK